ncbi:MAG: hypothetical protein KDA89_05380 [Planctomycetaceae bacterium]|nr:hypothetical protein [Planctomycetaceae bacterium]
MKLPDRKLLGRKGKCPKCEHRFVMTEPEEVELQLAEPESPPVSDDVPMLGTGAKWVPDEIPTFGSPESSPPGITPPTGFPGADVAPPGIPEELNFGNAPVGSRRKGSRRRAAPGPLNIAVPESPPADGFPNLESADRNAAGFPDISAVESPAAGLTDPPTAGTLPADSGSNPAVSSAVASRMGQRRRRKRGGAGMLVAVSAAVLFVAGAGWLWHSEQTRRRREVEAAAQQQQPKINQEWQEEKQEMAAVDEDARQLSPTSGGAVELDFLPFTPHLVLHLRPSEIWSADVRNREFIATLGDLGNWLQQEIVNITRFEPQEIEELTIALNFGPRTSPPDVGAVVRLRAEQTMSDLKNNRFRGSLRPDFAPTEVYESDPYSYMLIDTKTFAVGPITMSDSLAAAKSYPPTPPVGLDPLLRESDRDRHLTLMFDVTNMDTHREYIFPEEMQHVADQLILWFGKDIQTVSWSMHLGPELFMETLLHENHDSSPLKVQRHMKSRMAGLPDDMLHLVRRMTPATVGYQEMIGRYPAMLKSLTLGTTTSVGPASVRLITLLPGKAAANLAAASLYTWNQSVVTDLTQTTAVAAAPSRRIPETVAERLKLPVIVFFRRTPLQEAVAFIGEEIKTTFRLNGDALKFAGMTQNMPQTYNLGEVPAIKAIDAIISNPDYRDMLVIVVNEQEKSIEMTTRAAAEQAGLQIYNTKAAAQ